MTARDDLDRHLTAWLMETAPMDEPELLLGQVLARTARTRRRPAWLIPERWTILSAISTSAAAVSRMPWRTVGALTLLILALVVGAVLVAGSRPRAVPAPFGPAANGQILYSVNGDILAVNSPSASPRTIVAGSAFDSGPWFSPDGTRIIFARGAMDSADAELWVADADGANPRKLAATPQIGWVEWSPTADAIAVSLDGDVSVIHMVASDGGGSTDIRTGLLGAWNPVFRPAGGGQMAFRGQATDLTWGIYLIDRDGANLRRLELDPGFEADDSYATNRDYYFESPAWSPDGTRLMYHTLEPDSSSVAGPGFRIHIADVSAAGSVTSERTLEYDPSSDDEYAAAWLPSGDGIVYQTIEGTAHRLMLAGLADGAVARDLGIVANDHIGFQVSPDGKQVIASVPVGAEAFDTWVVDLTTFASTKVAIGDDYSWQRRAP